MDLASAPNHFRDVLTGDPSADRMVEVQSLGVPDVTESSFQREWQALADKACEPNPFLEPWFVLPSLEAFAAKPAAISMLCVRYHGELVGLLPLVRDWTYYGYPLPHLSSWTHDNSFCGAPLVATRHEARFWRALIEQTESGSVVPLFLHLPLLPMDGVLYQALMEVLAQLGSDFAIVEQQTRAFLHSDASAADYLAASMSAKKRKELRRQKKRLSEEGELAFERQTGPDGVDQWARDFLTLEASGWKGDAGSALANATDTSGFFVNALVGAAEAGRLERLAFTLNGQPIAMLANFITSPGAFSFKTAYDEAYARFSPGMLLQLENLALLDRDDIAWADSCAAEGHPMIERLWREKRTLVSLNIAIGGPFRRTIARRLMAHETRNRTTA